MPTKPMNRTRHTAVAVAATLFLLYGAFAVFLGQDTSWDTLNYHVYNPYAFLTGRLSLDLAPAQLQSYFNPVLDLPVYWLTQHVRPWLVGFWLGGFQGLNALLIFLIARLLLSSGEKVPLWTPLGLACLGCLNASFVAQLGTAAGDSSSSPFVLLALYLACLWHNALTQRQAKSAHWAVWIGLLMGLVVGLKLTNAPFGLAMVLVLAVLPMKPANKVRQILLYGLAALSSFAISAGWWFYLVWVKFGSPLFPQFNRLFKSDLAAATSVIDTRWGPATTLEALTWPYWMSLRPWRIHDGLLYNHLWFLVFLVGLAWLARYLWRHRQGLDIHTTPSLLVLVLVFVASSYVIWLKVFSIGRYMTVVELLLPLLLLLGLKNGIWPKSALIVTLALSSLSLILGLKHSNFGVRAAWAAQSYSVTAPPLQNPASATILIAAGGAPVSWLLPYFPSRTAVLRISGNFPRSRAYDLLVRRTVEARGGEVYVIIATDVDWITARASQLDARLARINLVHGPLACKLTMQLVQTTRRYHGIKTQFTPDGRCHAFVENAGATAPVSQNDNSTRSTKELADMGYRIATNSCRSYPAFVGGLSLPYSICSVDKNWPLDHTCKGPTATQKIVQLPALPIKANGVTKGNT